MTNELTSKQKLEEFRKNSQYCWLCKLRGIKKETLFNGCSIQIVGITENGQVITPFDNDTGNMTALVPMCAYHMVLAQGGVLAQTTDGQIIQSKILTYLEPHQDAELNNFILKMRRALKTPENKERIEVAKLIIHARKFQKEMDEGIKKNDK